MVSFGGKLVFIGGSGGGSGGFVVEGDNESAYNYVAEQNTSDANPTEILLNNSTDQLIVELNEAVMFRILVLAVTSGAANSASWEIIGAARNSGGTTALIGTTSVTLVGTNGTTTGWAVDVAADDTSDYVKLTVTGVAGTDIRWAARVQTVEIKF